MSLASAFGHGELGLARKEHNTSPYSRWETINREIADKYLARNANNRPLRPYVVAKWMRTMKMGLWRPTHQGIAFDVRGNLLDGQHRLKAISDGNLSILMLVTYSLPSDSAEALDCGAIRTFVDVERLRGREIPRSYTATLRGMYTGLRIVKEASNVVLASLAERHHDAIMFALEVLPNSRVASGIRVGTILGVIARAYYTQPRERLREFGEVLKTGVTTSQRDSAAAKLWAWKLGGVRSRGETYAKAERALDAFLKGESLAKLYDAKEELFPLPEDQ